MNFTPANFPSSISCWMPVKMRVASLAMFMLTSTMQTLQVDSCRVCSSMCPFQCTSLYCFFLKLAMAVTVEFLMVRCSVFLPPPAPRLAGAGAADQRHQANLPHLQSLHCLLVHVEEMLSQEERSVSGRVGRHELLERLDVEQLVGLELLKVGELDLLKSQLRQFLKRRTSTTPNLEVLLSCAKHN